MRHSRPGGVTLVCVLAALGALIDLVTAQRDLSNFETAQWVEAHPREAQFEQLYNYLHAGITLLACYFMLHGRNWARWLYLGWSLLRITVAFTFMLLPNSPGNLEFLSFRAGMIPSMAFFLLALWMLCRADGREFFTGQSSEQE